MHFTKKNSSEKRLEFVKSLQSKKLLRFPGAYNPLCAKLIAEIGFDGVYISGGVMSNDLGLPDIGLTTLDQVSYRANQISRVTDLPTIVDADTGFKDCKKTIITFEEKGLAGCHLEDQVPEKRCGHLDNKELISTKKMVNKIKECVKAKKDKNFVCSFKSNVKNPRSGRIVGSNEKATIPVKPIKNTIGIIMMKDIIKLFFKTSLFFAA